MSGFSVLKLTDGTSAGTINLMTNEADGFFLQNYSPILSGYKGGGVFQDSPLADNRRPVYTRRETVVQPIVLSAKALSQDNIARMLQDLLRLVEKAKDYWASDWQNEPVWIEAKTSQETNTRYALVYAGRVEDYPAPYEQPFQQEGGTPVAQEMTLFLEHGQWLDVLPTVEGGSDLDALGARTYPTVASLIVSPSLGDTPTTITATDNASIQDLPDGANGFTVEWWFRAIGSIDDYRISFFDKSTGPGGVGWNILFAGGTAAVSTIMTARFENTAGDFFAFRDFSSFKSLVNDGQWHHIAVSLNKNGAITYPRGWVDGAELSSITTIPANGTYDSDVGVDLTSMVVELTARSGDLFEIGWIRLSDLERYTTSSFALPNQCVPPEIDANTVLQYNVEEGKGSTLDNAEGTSATDGSLAGTYFWTDVCEGVPITGELTVTTEEVFAANKFTINRINNIHLGTGGANLIGGSWPATILSSASTTYIGSDTTLTQPSGPFNSFVLNVGTTATAIASLTLEYWNGAWTTLSLSNDLDPKTGLTIDGVVILSWKPPADWATNSPGGGLPTGYWIRMSASAGSITHEGPDDPYTVTWPFIQIADTQLPGDIPNLARMRLRPVGSDGTNNASGAADKIIYGVRSLERGQSFRAYINMSDTNNVSGIDISQAPGAFISDNQAPTGRLVEQTATTSFANVGAVFLNGAVSRDYAGRFRVFIRFAYDIGTATELTWIFRTQYGTDGSFFDSRPVVIDDTYESGSISDANAYLMEFSPIHIRADLLVGNDTDIAELIFYPFVKTDTGTATIRLHDIVLIPTDEFSGEVERSPVTGIQADALNLIDLDGTNQKLYNRAVKRAVSDNRIKELWLSRGVLPPSLQANVTQRVFFLQRSSAGAASLERSGGWQTLGVQMGKVSRYLGFRGDR